jgi:hypothetical protein
VVAACGEAPVGESIDLVAAVDAPIVSATARARRLVATTKTIRVFILQDLTTEPSDTLFIDLRAPVNATVGNEPGTVTIRDDD